MKEGKTAFALTDNTLAPRSSSGQESCAGTTNDPPFQARLMVAVLSEPCQEKL